MKQKQEQEKKGKLKLLKKHSDDDIRHNRDDVKEKLGYEYDGKKDKYRMRARDDVFGKDYLKPFKKDIDQRASEMTLQFK